MHLAVIVLATAGMSAAAASLVLRSGKLATFGLCCSLVACLLVAIHEGHLPWQPVALAALFVAAYALALGSVRVLALLIAYGRTPDLDGIHGHEETVA